MEELIFIGYQDFGDGTRFALFNTLVEKGIRPKNTTISQETAEREGYTIPKLREVL